jgi:hypothetical protein
MVNSQNGWLEALEALDIRKSPELLARWGKNVRSSCRDSRLFSFASKPMHTSKEHQQRHR